MVLTDNGKALIVTLFFRMLFGGYIIGMDQYRLNDPESALTVFLIYALMAAFSSLYIFGKRVGLKGLIILEAVFLGLNVLFTILSLGQLADAGLHSPLNNIWQTSLRYMFSIVTLVFSIKAFKETG